ncbi:MAG: hypothetical protein A3G33_03285 [Omnitrophica bacterium RIFCSPLOWO2_12_FULL_44_17]|uniref:Uncharacterized protein n=1 Tax=Candidatus Danuiimicrobium aquiferis TaxID=1801832 RepID=A0A1G1KTR3_9BACT|nr:MAG: hypothetical protein A3B72_06830 [Omnitrophica bacterium RIFCSPHIGHO2_02_FULL_45_28]OGW90055.1 MAG: hypothetical protein A3E74_08150 [Omnitrophica bacterium RIFCSPHIGHO2_12_FULL_44_12]OGW96343.1 MAG: hypothetical protein A3G33_03285 [Omnitrophica bacterium RIFCSPLOWO2_12_FULL_44_17]OGX04848.1 MAG: hypothetical protein A3J12_07845 [Omnitrophica bacterium RIFCSPLOWO2_02_FULL_44_11]
MKVCFIHPPALMGVDNYSSLTQPPLGLAYLAAYIKRLGYEVAVVDAVGDAIERIERWSTHKKMLIQGLSFDEILKKIPANSDVVGVTCMFTHAWPMVRELLFVLKQNFPNAKLIAGGEHVSAMYDLVLQQSPVDICVLGEGEYTIEELLNVLKTGGRDIASVNGLAYLDQDKKVVKTQPRNRIDNLDALPWPAWDLFDPDAYMRGGVYMGPVTGRSMPLLASRGCPYECTFCPAASMWKRAWKPRNPVDVVNEMEFYISKYQTNDFQLQDLTTIVRKDWIIALCKEMIQRKLNISWQIPVGTRSEVIDEEVVEYLVKSGCHHITYAPESASDRILKMIKKKVNLKNLEISVRASLKNGMRVCLFNVIGFPGEEVSDIKKTMKWLRRMARIGVHEITLSTFVPVPGSELFTEVNKVSPIDLDDEFCHVITGLSSLLSVRSWNPKITGRQLLFLKLWGLFQFYSLSFLYHPDRLWSLIRNAFSNKQQTKMDRVLREFIIKIPAIFRFSRKEKG